MRVDALLAHGLFLRRRGRERSRRTLRRPRRRRARALHQRDARGGRGRRVVPDVRLPPRPRPVRALGARPGARLDDREHARRHLPLAPELHQPLRAPGLDEGGGAPRRAVAHVRAALAETRGLPRAPRRVVDGVDPAGQRPLREALLRRRRQDRRELHLALLVRARLQRPPLGRRLPISIARGRSLPPGLRRRHAYSARVPNAVPHTSLARVTP
mmetsp:Transcript_25012/g.82929  ORF Transcript_25012/g.82929 Transcript_25012/m.82929 type:complete len:214 (-) Transcript_25012:15-656(-)